MAEFSAVCPCGWGLRARDPFILERARVAHLEDGAEGCDHVVEIEPAGPRPGPRPVSPIYRCRCNLADGHPGRCQVAA